MPAEQLLQDTGSPNQSWIRNLTNPITKRLAEGVARLPITANQVTLAGGIGVALGSLLRIYSAQHEDENPWHYIPALVLIGGGLAMDGIDGKVARINGTEGEGAGYDARIDRINNIVLGVTKMTLAHKNGSQRDQVLAALSTVAGQVPSFARALGEGAGLKVDEGGEGPLDILGTHVGRSALTLLGMSLPHILRIPQIETAIDRHLPISAATLQQLPYPEICDTLITVMSAKVARDRYALYRNPPANSPRISQNEQNQAREKIPGYHVLMGINMAAMLGTYYGLNHALIHQHMAPFIDRMGT